MPSQAAGKKPAPQELKGIHVSTFVDVRSVALFGSMYEKRGCEIISPLISDTDSIDFDQLECKVDAYRCRAALSIALSPAIAVSTWIVVSYRKLCVYQPEEAILLSCCSTEVEGVFEVPVYFRWNVSLIIYVVSVQESIGLGLFNLSLLRYDSCSSRSEAFEA